MCFTVTVHIPHMNTLYLCRSIHYTIIIYSSHMHVHVTGCQHPVDSDLKKYINNKLEVAMK